MAFMLEIWPDLVWDIRSKKSSRELWAFGLRKEVIFVAAYKEKRIPYIRQRAKASVAEWPLVWLASMSRTVKIKK
jgi:hypothetical protein